MPWPKFHSTLNAIVVVEKVDNKIIVKIAGELTVDEEVDYKREVMSHLKGDFDELIMDMEEVTFLDSTGIGILIFFERHLKEINKNMFLKNLQEPIYEILRLGFFHKFFKIID